MLHYIAMRVLDRLHASVFQEADLAQRARLMLASVGIGSWLTPLVVRGEIYDRINPESADPDVTPTDLLNLYEEVTAAKGFRDQYRILARPLPNNENKPVAEQRVWFDAIGGLTNGPILSEVAKYARWSGPVTELPWTHAADLGAGTGTLGRMLVNHGPNRIPTAKHVTMIDAVPELLAVAEARGGPDIDYHCGDVLDIDFGDESFDLMVSGGLAYLLGHELQAPFFREVHRLLKPGGFYIDGDQHQHEWTTLNPGRFQLQSFIMSHLSGTEMLGDPLSHREDFPFRPYTYEEKSKFFSSLGFYVTQKEVKHDSAEPIIVRILEKN